MYSSPQFGEGRPLGPGFGHVDESCIGWHQRHVARLLSALVLCLSSIRGVRSCGGRHGVGSRLGVLGAFVFNF